MIVKGKSRGDALQLATYLLDKRDNEDIQILGIYGTATPDDLKRSLLEMELTVELTDGWKGLHHGQIAPRDFESREMTMEDWHYCVETYAKNTGHEGQKWAAVLHTKNGSTHAHVVFERYNHDTGQLIRDSFNYYDNNQTRADLEEHFGHERTPWRRDKTHEENHKVTLTQIWEYSENGQDFIDQAESMGYQVAKGLDKRPYKVITPDGKSLDLVRQLQGVKTADVKKDLDKIQLQTEAEALRKITNEKKNSVELKRKEFIDNLDEIQPVKQEPKKNQLSDEERLLAELMKKAQEQQEKRLRMLRQNQQDQGMTQ